MNSASYMPRHPIEFVCFPKPIFSLLKKSSGVFLQVRDHWQNGPDEQHEKSLLFALNWKPSVALLLRNLGSGKTARVMFEVRLHGDRQCIPNGNGGSKKDFTLGSKQEFLTTTPSPLLSGGCETRCSTSADKPSAQRSQREEENRAHKKNSRRDRFFRLFK